jgi:type IV secretory pathway VirB4 component
MKHIFFFFITFLSLNSYGQITRLHFYYDDAGNQITRKLNFNSESTRTSESIIPKEITELKEEDLLKFSPEDVISYYPNPVREELYLKWELTNENKVSSIEVFSINGQHIKTFSNLEKENTKNISFQEYPLGTYLVVLNYTSGEQKSITILKQ